MSRSSVNGSKPVTRIRLTPFSCGYRMVSLPARGPLQLERAARSVGPSVRPELGLPLAHFTGHPEPRPVQRPVVVPAQVAARRGTSDRAAAPSTGSSRGSASPGSAGSPGTARRPGGRCGRRCRPACRRGSCRSRTAARLVGGDLQGAAGVRVVQGRDVLGLRGDALVEDPVVVVALGLHLLDVAGPDVAADRLGLRKSKGVPATLASSPGGDQPRVGGRVAGGGDRELVVLDRAAALAGEVPVDVVGEVDDRGLVGGGLVVDAPVAVLG
jgi:hypothetical protein